MIIKSYTHEIASRQEFEMVKITDQVQKDVAASFISSLMAVARVSSAPRKI